MGSELACFVAFNLNLQERDPSSPNQMSTTQHSRHRVHHMRMIPQILPAYPGHHRCQRTLPSCKIQMILWSTSPTMYTYVPNMVHLFQLTKTHIDWGDDFRWAWSRYGPFLLHFLAFKATKLGIYGPSPTYTSTWGMLCLWCKSGSKRGSLM